MSKKGKSRRGHGEGSITKRKDGRWQGSVLIGYNPDTGRPKRKYFYGKTRKEVQQKLSEVIPEVQAGIYREPSKLTVAKWFSTWLNNYMKISLRPTTWESYRYQVEGHIIPELGHLRLSQLQTAHLQALYNSKMNSGRLDGKKGGLSPRSIKYIHTVIRSALEQAKKEGIITINPADATELPKQEKKEIKSLGTAEAAIFLAIARESKHFAAFYLAINTGMRRGEILALRWQDLDLVAGQLTISQGLVRVKKLGLVFQEPKTKLSQRVINLAPAVLQVLKNHKRQQNEARLIAGSAYNADLDLVFANELGEPICPRAFTRVFERLIKKTGLDVTFHGLRHTFATIALEQGVDIKTIQETLGHHSAAFTMDVYSSVTAKMKKEAADRVGDLLASLMQE